MNVYSLVQRLLRKLSGKRTDTQDLTIPQTAESELSVVAAPPAQTERPDWVPDWKRLVQQAGPSWGAVMAEQSKKKVLIATVAGGHDACTPIESLVATALKVRGADVHVLLCDGVIPACLQVTIDEFASVEEFTDHGVQRKFCSSCFDRGLQAFQIPGVTIHTFSQYLTPEDKQLAARIAAESPVQTIETFEFDGVPIGDQIHAACARFLVRGDLGADPAAEVVLRRYLEAAILSVIVARRLYAEQSFDTVVINHGIYVPHGPLAATARAQKRHVVAWSLSYRNRCVVFSHDNSDIFTIINEPTSVWEDMPWTEQMEADIMEYLYSRSNSCKQDWIMPFHKDSERDLQVLSANYGIDFSKPVVGLCTNVIWDGAVCYAENSFCSMVAWLLMTIRYFVGRPDIQLVVRIHPAEVRMTNVSRERAVDAIQKEFPVLPQNVFVIPPESDANTYIIMEHCNAVAIYGTSMGMELCARGLPVIVAGQAWIRNKGIAREANTEEQYINILNELPFNGRMSGQLMKRARKYAYHYCMRRCIPLEHAFVRDGWPFLGVRVESLEDLRAGKALGLDTVCNGILTGSDFIYPAETMVSSVYLADTPSTTISVP